MQKAPVLKGSGLQPVSLKAEETTHVFGKNLEERVITKEGEESPSASFDSSQSNDLRGGSGASTTASASATATAAATTSTSNNQPQEDDIETIRKRKYDATTGEEDEETIFQGDFKLFVWDLATSNWTEKGRGQLKLNISPSEKKSRLIMRVNGTLRIILNVSIKYSHFKIITDSKTIIRFTDSQTVWAVSGSNAQELKRLIEERLEISKESEPEKDNKPVKDEDEKKPEEPKREEEKKHQLQEEEGEENEEDKRENKVKKQAKSKD